jgi:hypothetical protein
MVEDWGQYVDLIKELIKTGEDHVMRDVINHMLRIISLCRTSSRMRLLENVARMGEISVGVEAADRLGGKTYMGRN